MSRFVASHPVAVVLALAAGSIVAEWRAGTRVELRLPLVRPGG